MSYIQDLDYSATPTPTEVSDHLTLWHMMKKDIYDIINDLENEIVDELKQIIEYPRYSKGYQTIDRNLKRISLLKKTFPILSRR